MITSNKQSKPVAWYLPFLKSIKFLTKFILKPPSVKFPFKYFLITVLATVLIWSVIASAIIYRNAYKPEIGKLAEVLSFKGRREKHRLGKAVQAFLFAPFNWASAYFNSEKIPHIFLDIKFKNYQKLLNNRNKAILRGFNVTTPDSYIPATLRYQRDTYKIKLRLKGDQPDHWSGDKWSFRIHMKGKDHLLGIRRFSLQEPATRGFEGEIIFFEALRREGVLTPRYFFVDLTVNGKYIGVMAFEEHFSKELLESQGRRESVILKFDESLTFFDRTGPFESYMNNPIKPFRYKKISRSPIQSEYLKLATGLLRGFVEGKLSSSQVFDVELMGRFLAVASVWGAWHPIRWHNIRFYYNPITAKLEPVGYDAQLPYFKRKSVEPSNNPLASALLQSDFSIRPFYEATLKKLKNEAEKGITEEWVMPIQKRSLRILHKEYPLLGGINLFGMAEGASQSLQRSNATSDQHKKIMTANLIKDSKESYLELLNHLPQNISIDRIERVDRKTGNSISLKARPSLKYPFSLPRTPARTAPHSKKIFFQERVDTKKFKIIVSAHIEGNEKLWVVEALNYFSAIEKNPVTFPSIDQVLVDHPFLEKAVDSRSLVIKQGEWIVNNSLVIPKNMPLVFSKGTTLKFNSKSALITSGPILIQGTEDSPVVLQGLGSHQNEKKLWQGIVLLKTQDPSIWSHVKIYNTSGISKEGWVLSGGVNFYESDVKMDHVLFSGNNTEDALNIVRSKFDLKNITIQNTTSDAFDSDFSNGTVENGTFENIGSLGGGDGIDTSGSEVVVTATNFKNISDKALSVGESSNLKATGVNIEQADIGFASKDGSQLFVSKSRLSRVKKAGLMAYVKKPIYGPAKIEAEDLEIHATKRNAVAQEGSKIFIDGKVIPPVELNVEKLYSTGGN